MQATPPGRQRGVSVIEATLVASIAAVTLGIVAPGFERMTQLFIAAEKEPSSR